MGASRGQGLFPTTNRGNGNFRQNCPRMIVLPPADQGCSAGNVDRGGGGGGEGPIGGEPFRGQKKTDLGRNRPFPRGDVGDRIK